MNINSLSIPGKPSSALTERTRDYEIIKIRCSENSAEKAILTFSSNTLSMEVICEKMGETVQQQIVPAIDENEPYVFGFESRVMKDDDIGTPKELEKTNSNFISMVMIKKILKHLDAEWAYEEIFAEQALVEAPEIDMLKVLKSYKAKDDEQKKEALRLILLVDANSYHRYSPIEIESCFYLTKDGEYPIFRQDNEGISLFQSSVGLYAQMHTPNGMPAGHAYRYGHEVVRIKPRGHELEIADSLGEIQMTERIGNGERKTINKDGQILLTSSIEKRKEMFEAIGARMFVNLNMQRLSPSAEKIFKEESGETPTNEATSVRP